MPDLPAGDSATRSAMFDCMATGQGLPVFFDPFLHSILPFSDVVRYEDISVLFEERRLKLGDGEFIDQLSTASKTPQYTRDLGKLQLLQHIWQYRNQPHLDLVTFESMSVIADTDDALTMSMKAMLRRLCSLGRLAQYSAHCPS